MTHHRNELALRLTVSAWAFAIASAILVLAGIACLTGAVSARGAVALWLLLSAVFAAAGALALRNLRQRLIQTSVAGGEASVEDPSQTSLPEAHSANEHTGAVQSTEQLRWLPWLAAFTLFLVGFFLEDVGLGIILGLAGLVVGILSLKATEDIGSSRR